MKVNLQDVNRKYKILALTSNLVLGLFVSGLTLLGAYAVFDSKLAGFAGLIAALGSVGVAGTRLLIVSPKLFDKATTEVKDEQDHAREAELRQLNIDLQRDDDPRTDEALADLKALLAAFKSQQPVGKNDSYVASSILEKVEAIFDECVACLKQTYVLYLKSKDARSKKIRKIFSDERDALVVRVLDMIKQLGKGFESFVRISVTPGEDFSGKLEQLGKSFDLQIEVCNDVSQRMKQMMGGSNGVDNATVDEYAKAADDERQKE